MTIEPIRISNILKSHQLSPKKSLGQNFLQDPVILEKIVDAADIPPEASVLEIGPGLGSLTRYLADRAKHVVAVELDQNLIPALEDVMSPWDNVDIIHNDILKIDPNELINEDGYLVVANIPYYITSAVIRHLLEAPKKPKRIVLTIQKEVANRICEKPGKMSLLGLSVQVYGQPKKAAIIPAGAFYPPPKVDSAVIRIDLYDEPQIPVEQLDTFFKVAKAGFSQKRKTLLNALSGGLHLAKPEINALMETAGIDPQRRAQTLTIAEWGALTAAYQERK
jgi:16S rRNA (adenine1518-N6/adenine1519-N6)-dimethyltransferase